MKKSIFYIGIILSIFLTNMHVLGNENKGIFKEENKLEKYEMRGVWVPTIINLNMPSGMNKKEFEIWADKLIKNVSNYNFNTVYFQIRPSADALYKSKIVPWSSYITGKKQGTDPLYDPLEILIKKAHDEGIELHGWLNPYRVTFKIEDFQNLDKNNVAVKHPDWTMKYGNNYYLNPGVKEVQNHLIEVVKEIIDNYDLDGIHFDDYFYPYPVKGDKIPDEKEFEKYGQNFANIEDWRRYNITSLVENINNFIKSSKKPVQFGIAPFGIWKNSKNDIEGSDTNGLESYNSIFVDSIDWIKKGIVDYLSPQIYWSTENKEANFIILKDWWAKQIEKNKKSNKVNLYLGLANYKVGTDKDTQWNNPEEMLNQIKLIREKENIKGQAHFSYLQVMENKLNHTEMIKENLYKYKALNPPIINNQNIPNAPKKVTGKKSNIGIELKIHEEDKNIKKYSIYRFNEDEKEIFEGKNLLGVIYRNRTNTFLDKTARKGKNYKYGIKSISFSGEESRDSKIIEVKN